MTTTASPPRAITVLSVLLGLLYLGTGIQKLVGAQMVVDNFARWGYPDWFRYPVGIGEVVTAVLLFLPRTRLLGGAAVVVLMLGAVRTHAQAGEWGGLAGTSVLAVLGALVAWSHRPRR